MFFRAVGILLLLLVFQSLCLVAFADSDFDISTKAVYQVQKNGETFVTENVSIKNKKEFVYLPSYTIITSLQEAHNVSGSNSKGPLKTLLKNGKQGKEIEIIFPKRSVGKGVVNTFHVFYLTKSVFNRGDLVWELKIPGLEDPQEFLEYNVDILTPPSFGKPTIVKPYRESTTQNYTFNKTEIGKSGILMVFGESQSYVLNLSYHLSGNQAFPVKSEIAIPPNTSYQDVQIRTLDPKPINLYEDADGNMLAVYEIKPKTNIEVKATINVRLYPKPTFEMNDVEQVTSGNKYWETGDESIKNLAQRLAGPGAIYEFTKKAFSYDFNLAHKHIRIGAALSLKNPKEADCFTFTDLFIALARSEGITARSAQGVYYTSNLGSNGVQMPSKLHCWPEYYDTNLKTWVMVDPTLANISQGLDYFNSFDLNHIAFAIRGQSSTYPIPAGESPNSDFTRDVVVRLGSNDGRKQGEFEISADFPSAILPGFSAEGRVTIKNNSGMPISKPVFEVVSDFSPKKQTTNANSLLPYSSASFPVRFDRTAFLTSKVFTVKIFFKDQTLTKTIKVGIFFDYFLFILGGVIICGSIIVALAAYKTWGLLVQSRRR